MLDLRFAAAAAVAVSLAGCSFFDFSDEPATTQQVENQSADQSVHLIQLAALPGYLSDEDLVPADSAGPALGNVAPLAEIPRKPTRVGVPSQHLDDAVTAAPVRPRARPRLLSLGDLVPQGALSGLTPLKAPMHTKPFTPVTPKPITLADLVVDQAWRKRTARKLERLFQ